MKKAYIVYRNYYDFKKNKITIGGIQTYITDLTKVCLEIGLEPVVLQPGEEELTHKENGVIINQYKIDERNRTKKYKKELTKRINHNELVIFATDNLIPDKSPFMNSIVIQHGISWDIPMESGRGQLREFISKCKNAYVMINRLQYVNKIVCVDYNFINWYRTQVDKVNGQLVAIPNYSKLAPVYHKPDDTLNIIFARRLFEYRGTRVFTKAIKILLEEYKNINVTVAGSGPDENWMKTELSRYKCVKFIQYESEDSLKIHEDKHIAVVPTVGSEGTSLSLLEAMSAQCTVIASDVGGMTNIILDGYNGLLVSAGDEQSLLTALRRVIECPNLRTELSHRAYETVESSFSHEKWREKWVAVLKSVMR